MSTALPVVVLLTDLSHAPHRRVLSGLIDYVRPRRCWSLRRVRPENAERLRAHLRNLGATGCLLTSELLKVKYATEVVHALRIPAVATLERSASLPSVIADESALGQKAAEHLLGAGLRELAFLGYSRRSPWLERERGFIEVARAAGARVVSTFLEDLEAGSGTVEEAINQWVRALPRGAGLMTGNDYLGSIVAEQCELAGISVPDDLALVGVDNDETDCELSPTPLSSVPLPAEAIGYRAAEVLAAMMAGEPAPAAPVVVQGGEVVVRRSTEVLRVSDPAVAAAIRFIRARAAEGCGVEDVVAAAEVSRRGLERSFRRTLGCSIYDEIRRARVDLARRLLEETALGVEDVAAEAGFADYRQMRFILKRQTGCSPREYRKRFGKVRR